MLKSISPFGELPSSGSSSIYFFFRDLAVFFLRISFAAVSARTKISAKSFIISSISCVVFIPFSPFQCSTLIFSFSFLCFNYIPNLVYCQQFFNYKVKKRMLTTLAAHPLLSHLLLVVLVNSRLYLAVVIPCRL